MKPTEIQSPILLGLEVPLIMMSLGLVISVSGECLGVGKGVGTFPDTRGPGL